MPEAMMVVKRNGDIEPFALGRIALAVFRAAQAQKLAASEGRRLGAQAGQIVSQRLASLGRSRLDVEEIQDEVVGALRQLDRRALADAYQAYRESRAVARGQLALSRKAERPFRWDSALGAVEVGREAWAEALRGALDQGAKKEWTVAQWWAACKEDAARAKTFDDFVGAHIKALLEACEERESWLGSARALLMERWRLRVSGASPLLSGQEAAKKAEQEHFKLHWAWRRSEQKAPWFAPAREIEALAQRFDPKLDERLGFAGLAAMEKLFGWGPQALLPQEIFANCALTLCWAGDFEDPRRVGDGRGESSAALWDMFARARLMAPLPLMRQSRNAYPSLAQETHVKVGDSLESIFEALGKTVSAIKAGVSAAVELSALRAEGTSVGREGQTSAGLAPVLRLFGEACGMLRGRDGEKLKARVSLACWHRDLESFLAHCKIAPKEMRLSVSLPDAFMRRVFDGGMWILASPSEAPRLGDSKGADFERWVLDYCKMAKAGQLGLARVVPARDVFDWICQCVAASEGPSVVFSDACIPFDAPKTQGGLSSRMATIFNQSEPEAWAMDLGLNLGSPEEALEAMTLAHRTMGRMAWRGRPLLASVVPVGEVEAPAWAGMLAQASARLDLGQALPAESFWAKPSPWAARAQAIESGRGGYVEREEQAWRVACECARSKGPRRLANLAAREEYLWLAGANPVFANHAQSRRQVRFEGVRVGFGGSGALEPLKRQVARAAAWQKWSDGALALDARLESASPEEIAEAIKLAWLHGLSGVRRFVGPRPAERR